MVATLILTAGLLQGGTALTAEFAKALRKPLRMVDLGPGTRHEPILDWMQEERIQVLNVAGPRASEAPGIYGAARQLLDALFGGVSRPA